MTRIDPAAAGPRLQVGTCTDSTNEVRQLRVLDRFLASAPPELLGALLAEVAIDDDYGAGFFCACCQRTESAQVQHGPAAYVIDGTTWACSRCRRRRSRWVLAGEIRNRPTARTRALEFLDEEANRG